VIRIGPVIAPHLYGPRRRTLAYTCRRPRRRRAGRSARAPGAVAVNTEAMIFDQPPAELPVATLRPRDGGARFLLDVRGWLAARWRWLRPRAIPVAVAFAGMLGVLASASYLRELAHRPPEPSEPSAAPVITARTAEAPVARALPATRPVVTIVTRNGQPVSVKVEPRSAPHPR
jgi:hypothetical protein